MTTVSELEHVEPANVADVSESHVSGGYAASVPVISVGVSPVIVQLQTEEHSCPPNVDECYSGSNISECGSENGVHILINPIDTEYAGKFQDQLRSVPSVSPPVEVETDTQCERPSEVPESCQPCPQVCEDLTSRTDCAVVCPQCVYDVNCPECVSSAAQYGLNNNAHPVYPIPGATMPIQYDQGTCLVQQPPPYQQPAVYAPPPVIQEPSPPIYFVPPPQSEEWVATNGANTDGQPAGIVDDVTYQQPGPQLQEELPAIHISGAGMITVLLRDDVAIEMTLDRSIRAINHRFGSVISVTNDGKESCLFHRGVRIKQKEGHVTADMFHNRRVIMDPEEIKFAFEDSALKMSRDIISSIQPSAFPEPTEGDDTIGLIYTSTGVHPHLIPACEEAITNSRYTREKNGSVVVDINNVRIRQERNCDVTVISTPKRIRLSPSTGWIGIQTDCVSMSVGQFWDTSIQCGKNVLSASNQHMFYVFNGWATAGFDGSKTLFTHRKPYSHRRPFDHRRAAYPGLRPPQPRYIAPPLLFMGFRPRGRPQMRYPLNPSMRWCGPRDVRKVYPNNNMYQPPQRYFRGGRRHSVENQNWRQRDRQPEPRQEEEVAEETERPRSPDSSEQVADTTATTEEVDRNEPQPRKRVNNFKREQTRGPSEADSDEQLATSST